jgi:hypothetical protein
MSVVKAEDEESETNGKGNWSTHQVDAISQQ